MEQVPIPDRPLRVAIIGAGNRTTTIYKPLIASLAPWMTVAAVCDPVRAHADALAGALGARAYNDARALVGDRPMEAAIVIAPVESHHSLSCYLSAHGIHNLVETSWCNTLRQARDMIAAARAQGVVVRVAENFFRFPVDRIVQKIRSTNVIGPIRRIVSYDDHTGYHNDSRWIAFAGAHPAWVQAIDHTMQTASFDEAPQRHHADETYHARFFGFPDGLLVVDHACNAKGFLGRYPRPGYTEWHGERGTIVHFARRPWDGETEVRWCSDAALATGHGFADHTFTVVEEVEDRAWTRSYVDLPTGRVEHENPFRPAEPAPHHWASYGAAIMDHVVDFILAVRGLRKSEFDDEDALMSMMMEVGARESSRAEGKRVRLPIDGEPESDRAIHETIRAKYGVDPLDVEGMLSVSFPRP